MEPRSEEDRLINRVNVGHPLFPLFIFSVLLRAVKFSNRSEFLFRLIRTSTLLIICETLLIFYPPGEAAASCVNAFIPNVRVI